MRVKRLLYNIALTAPSLRLSPLPRLCSQRLCYNLVTLTLPPSQRRDLRGGGGCSESVSKAGGLRKCRKHLRKSRQPFPQPFSTTLWRILEAQKDLSALVASTLRPVPVPSCNAGRLRPSTRAAVLFSIYRSLARSICPTLADPCFALRNLCPYQVILLALPQNNVSCVPGQDMRRSSLLLPSFTREGCHFHVNLFTSDNLLGAGAHVTLRLCLTIGSAHQTTIGELVAGTTTITAISLRNGIAVSPATAGDFTRLAAGLRRLRNARESFHKPSTTGV